MLIRSYFGTLFSGAVSEGDDQGDQVAIRVINGDGLDEGDADTIEAAANVLCAT